MDRHKDWCTIVCLIGGGQEINTGEAGLSEWVNSIMTKFPKWKVHYSDLIVDSSNYINSIDQKKWLAENASAKKELHLAVSLRSFRSEKLSEFVHALLNLEQDRAMELYQQIHVNFPIYLTRNLNTAKQWLKDQKKGSERTGIIASSGARRLRTEGINVKNEILPANWFLNVSIDIRSSDFLEETATEFDIQGLEIDWACLAWGANLYYKNDEWYFQNFKGTKWQNIKQQTDQDYLLNAYRVLLTRARQGMVIFIPFGDNTDITRSRKFYDGTWDYLCSIGVEQLD